MLREHVILPASEEDQIRELDKLLRLGSPALVGADGERIQLPNTVYGLLKDIVRNMQAGRAIVLMPEKQQLTTQRAAGLLWVSRPHVIKLLNSGELPYHMVGSHRRIYLADVLTFAKRRDSERHAALNQLAQDAYNAGLYDVSGVPEGGNDE